MQNHIPVLLKEIVSMLSPKDGEVFFDGTFGGGGYTKAILEASDNKVIACDRDLIVQETANEFKKKYKDRFCFSHAKFSDIRTIIESHGVEKLDGIVLDLGVSNFQLTDASRGFSFRLKGPLDMGMGLCEETAMEVIRKYSEQDLANIIYKFGEEHFSRRIAKNIKLNLNRIENTEDLANVIHECMRKKGKADTATKTFQALRIFVNKELDELTDVLNNSINLLKPNGRIAIVSFHSLEDRIVKLFFKDLALQEKRTKYKLLTKKPIVPSREEILSNPKSRSAKLRGISVLS